MKKIKLTNLDKRIIKLMSQKKKKNEGNLQPSNKRA